MTTSQHIATASLLSRLTGLPVAGFLIGLVSHAVLDIVEPQEYKINPLNWQYEKDIIMLEISLSLALFYFALGNWIMIWTITGALFPDIVDGILSIIDRTRYQKGRHFFWFHRPDKEIKKTMTKRVTMILSIILFILVII